MNLRELKIFKTVCETGSMSETGRRLYMTQPAISQTIADLEAKLNVKLFERLNKKLILTNTGKILLKYSKKILMLVDEAQNNIKDIANMKHGKLRIGASMTIGTYLLPDILSNFNSQYQNINIPFIIDNTSVIENKILNNDIDIGLVEGPVHSKDITPIPFFDDELCLICSPNHNWANKRLITLQEIEHEDFIVREDGSGTREVIEKNMAKYNTSCKFKHVLNNIEAIKKAIKADLGISILPTIAVEEEIKSHSLVKVAIKEIEFKRKFNIIYHKDKYHSKLFNNFIDYLTNKKVPF